MMQRFALALFLLLPPIVLAQYRTAQQEQQYLLRLQKQYSPYLTLDTIGISAGGLPILVAKVHFSPSDTLPAVLVVGGIHPGDLTSTYVCVSLLEQVLQRGMKQKELYRTCELYFIPRLSPDPLEGYFQTPQREYFGNWEPEDSDRDGLIDEDDVEDLDGDGKIRWMRIFHPSGGWTYHPDDSLLNKPADTARGEVAHFSIAPEGKDTDGDGMWNEDPKGGVNIDRNFTYRYAPYHPGHGRHAFSAPEVRAIASFLFTHPQILAVLCFTPYDNLHFPWKIRYPHSITQPNRFRTDSLVYQNIVHQLRPLIPYTGERSVPPGSFGEWLIYHAGRFSFCAPAWSYPPADSNRASEESVELRALRWIQQHDPDKFQNWQLFPHPDVPYDSVFIGGFAPFALWTAPADSLPHLTDRWLPVLSKLAELLPRITIRHWTEALHRQKGAVHRVTIEISNEGVFPTHTQIGRAVRALQPLHITVQTQREQKLLNKPDHFLIPDPLVGRERKRISLVILGSGTVTVRISSPSAGSKTIRIPL